jgi:hypothetical protein
MNMETTLHLWWNGYDHAPGATAEDASRWYQQQTGESEEGAEGDGWVMVPDAEEMRDEDEPSKPTGETAAMFARFLASRPAPTGGEGERT